MSIFAKIRSFLLNTMEEMKKCTWPNRDQLVESTLLVMITLFILAGYVALVDFGFTSFIKWIIAA